MMSFGEYAAFLEGSIARVEPGLLENTKVLMDAAAARAKSVIGTYEAGWKPLAPSTIADRVRHGYSPNEPLLRSGGMRGSIESEAEIDGFGVTGAIGSDEVKALWQELGTSRAPPRPFLAYGLVESLPAAEFLFGNFAMSLLMPGRGE